VHVDSATATFFVRLNRVRNDPLDWASNFNWHKKSLIKWE